MFRVWGLGVCCPGEENKELGVRPWGLLVYFMIVKKIGFLSHLPDLR